MLLQSAHYGLPQDRVRFFMIAAKRGYLLPEVPQPTHRFSKSDSLEIKFPNEAPIHPVQTDGRNAPFRFTTIADAIGDLPRFDWCVTYRGCSAAARDRLLSVLDIDAGRIHRNWSRSLFLDLWNGNGKCSLSSAIRRRNTLVWWVRWSISVLQGPHSSSDVERGRRRIFSTSIAC